MALRLLDTGYKHAGMTCYLLIFAADSSIGFIFQDILELLAVTVSTMIQQC